MKISSLCSSKVTKPRPICCHIGKNILSHRDPSVDVPKRSLYPKALYLHPKTWDAHPKALYLHSKALDGDFLRSRKPLPQ